MNINYIILYVVVFCFIRWLCKGIDNGYIIKILIVICVLIVFVFEIWNFGVWFDNYENMK